MPYKDPEKNRVCSRQSEKRALERARQTPLTQSRVKEVLIYNPATGDFIWKSARRRFVGKVAGKMTRCGHRQIKVDGRHYHAHRLAWLYMMGAFPPLTIDHIDGDPDNNRFENLRLATPSQNQMNVRRRVDNWSGKRGVSFNRKTNRWVAYIQVDKRHRHLGGFETFAQALTARLNAEREFYGEFNRTGT